MSTISRDTLRREFEYLLREHDMTENYVLAVQKEGCFYNKILESIPPQDWILSAFGWSQYPGPKAWVNINHLWLDRLEEIGHEYEEI